MEILKTFQITKLGKFTFTCLKIAMCVLILFGVLIFLLQIVLGNDYRVSGRSMEPTIKDGDMVRTSPCFIFNICSIKLKRGDIVIFLDKDSKELHIKRIIGLPNEVVNIDNSHIFIASKELNEPYLSVKHDGLLQKLSFYVPPTHPCIGYRLGGDEYLY